jgi:hypothetical protein
MIFLLQLFVQIYLLDLRNFVYVFATRRLPNSIAVYCEHLRNCGLRRNTPQCSISSINHGISRKPNRRIRAR